jgi:DNA-binding beta-propeller fold protein YncE
MSVFFGISSRLFKYSHTVGQLTFGGWGFTVPAALAVAKDGAVYVVNRPFGSARDPSTHAAVHIDVVTLDEELITEFGGKGTEDGEFIWPTSIALDQEGRVYLSDEFLNRITIYDKDGKFLDKWGVSGSKDGELNHPSGIAFDKEDNLYLVDGLNHRVQIFTKDGRFLGKFGSFGNGEGQLNTPWGIAIDSMDDVYIADWRNDRIQKFTSDGKFLGGFGSSGDMIGQFNRPAGVAVDKDGDIYVADWLNNRVQIFNSDFRYINQLVGSATLSKWTGALFDANPSWRHQYLTFPDFGPYQRFWCPEAVVVDDEGTIVVADTCRGRLQVYKKELVAEGVAG